MSLRRCASILAVCICCGSAGSDPALAGPIPSSEANLPQPSSGPLGWPAITPECRPGAYWWWMGSAVNAADLSRELQRYRAAGMGGVHIIPIYGAKGYESQYLEYLSPQWMAMLNHTVSESHRLDLFVDMTLGSGWCFGGPNVAPQEACALLDLHTYALAAGSSWRQSFDPQTIQALVAFKADGTSIDLKGQIDRNGALDWRPEGGPWQIYALSQKPSRCPVKRAAPGGAGPMLNPFYGQAMRHYLERFSRALADYHGPKPRAVYHDSYEYNSNWSPDLLAEFAKSRGYSLTAELPAFNSNEANDHVARVKSDYRETISDMLIENTAPLWIAWAHAHGVLARYQAHGSPGNLLDLYALADIPETEMFHQDRNTFISKFASSAAHVAGRKLVASETGTWLKEHFTETLAELKDLVDQLFLSGVNHVIYHGTCYSPDAAPWPGWLFYASTEMNPRNAIWRDVPALNAYIARCQAILQAGRADNDVLLYWPVYDVWHDPAGMVQTFTVHKRYWIEPTAVGETSRRLWQRSYAFDYVSDRQLAGARAAAGQIVVSGGPYRAVLVPPCGHMPLQTLSSLISLAEQGGAVVFCDRLPQDVPGAADLEARRSQFQHVLQRLHLVRSAGKSWQTANVGQGRVFVGPLEDVAAAAGIPREPMTDHVGLQCIRRVLADGRYYFLANRGEQAVDAWIPLAEAAQSAAILDPMTGHVGVAASRKGARGQPEVYLQLEPGQSLVVQTVADRQVVGPPWQYQSSAGDPVVLKGNWRVEFLQGGPELPPPLETTKLASWTELGGPAAASFAGTARYTLTFDAPTSPAAAWLIDLGDVRQSARVRLNGQDLGDVFVRPFRVLASQLKTAGNVLEVEVTSVSANRIRDLDRRGVAWKTFHEINFVDINYKPFDASRWPLTPCGLIGPVRLLPRKIFSAPPAP